MLCNLSIRNFAFHYVLFPLHFFILQKARRFCYSKILKTFNLYKFFNDILDLKDSLRYNQRIFYGYLEGVPYSNQACRGKSMSYNDK